MMTSVNPYVAGNPVGGSPAFVGRTDILREVVRVLRRPQDNAIVLYGQRRVGKTSMLQHLVTQLPEQGPYCPVYFDLQDRASKSLGQVLRELADTVCGTLGQPAPDLGDNPETSFREEWLPAFLDDLPDGSSLILLFDEFDVLADPRAGQAAQAFFPYLRRLLSDDTERLQFVFVIGRNLDDLANIALSLFKGTSSRRVSLLAREDTANLIRLSDVNGTLHWPDDTVERVWQLTCGHPFLTQQLCSQVWEQAYDTKPEVPQTVDLKDVDAAIEDALETSRNTLEWLWDGLGPAERVVASALAEAGPEPIPQEELEQLLHNSGVRVVIRELQNAPQLLHEWDLLEPVDGGYSFRVELLRRWIAEHEPLSRVQEEMDRIEPVANNLYQAASGLYQNGQLDQATELLRQSVAINPNHVKASLLLADILLAQEQAGEARQLLDRLYEYHPAAAKHRLIQALIAEVQTAEGLEDRLVLYKRVLAIESTHPEASEKAAEVEQELRRRDLAAQMEQLEALEESGQYQDALDLGRSLADKYSDLREWKSDLERLERKTKLDDLYRRGLEALRANNRKKARTLLAEVVALEPRYEEATRYLHQAVTGTDMAELQTQLKSEKKGRLQAEKRADKEGSARLQYQGDLEAEKAAHQDTRNVRNSLQTEVQSLQSQRSSDQQTITNLQNKLRSLESQNGSYQQTIANLQNQLQSEKRARQQAESKASQYSSRSSELDKEKRARQKAQATAREIWIESLQEWANQLRQPAPREYTDDLRLNPIFRQQQLLTQKLDLEKILQPDQRLSDIVELIGLLETYDGSSTSKDAIMQVAGRVYKGLRSGDGHFINGVWVDLRAGTDLGPVVSDWLQNIL